MCAKKKPKKLAKFVYVCTLSLYMCSVCMYVWLSAGTILLRSVCMYVWLSAGTILLLGSSWYRTIPLLVLSDYG